MKTIGFEQQYGINLQLSGDADVGGNLDVGGDLKVEGNFALGDAAADTMTTEGPVTVGTNLTVNGNTTLGNAAGDTITVTGTMTCAETLTLTGALVANGNCTLGDAVADVITVNGTTTFAAPVTILHTQGAPGITSFGPVGSAARAGNFVAQHVDADGLRAATAAAASTSAAAIRAVAQGSSDGVVITAADGYGATIQSDTTSPVRAAMRCVPQNADPSSPQQGDLLFNSSRNQWRTYTTQQVSFHNSAKGLVDGFAEAADSATINSGDMATVTIVPEQTGQVSIEATGVFSMPNATDTFQFILRDVTAGISIRTSTVSISAAGEAETHVLRAVYTLPSSASRSFAFQVNGNGGNVVTRTACVLSVRGVQ
jgi:hypothetical protein